MRTRPASCLFISLLPAMALACDGGTQAELRGMRGGEGSALLTREDNADPLPAPVPLTSCFQDSDCEPDTAQTLTCDGPNVMEATTSWRCLRTQCERTTVTTLLQHCPFTCVDGQCREHAGKFAPPAPPLFPCADSEELQEAKRSFDDVNLGTSPSRTGFTAMSPSGQPDDMANRFRFSDFATTTLGWWESGILSALVEVYRATQDFSYLDQFVYQMDRVLGWRDDYYRDDTHPYGLRDFSGRIGRTWSFKQASSDHLYTQYEQTTGTLTSPMVDLALLVRQDPALADRVLYDGRTLRQKTDEYVARAKEAVAEHDRFWVFEGTQAYPRIRSSGAASCSAENPSLACSQAMAQSNGVHNGEDYDRCPGETTPVPFTGACVPINQSALLVRTMAGLFRLTGDAAYLKKLKGYAAFLKAQMTLDPIHNAVSLHHQCGDMLTGWSFTADRCPQEHPGYTDMEGITYFGIEVEAAYQLYLAGAGITLEDMKQLANTFLFKLYRPGDDGALAATVDGAGRDSRAPSGLFRLVEFEPSIYPILRSFYLSKPGPVGSEGDFYRSSTASMEGYARVMTYCAYAPVPVKRVDFEAELQ